MRNRMHLFAGLFVYMFVWWKMKMYANNEEIQYNFRSLYRKGGGIFILTRFYMWMCVQAGISAATPAAAAVTQDKWKKDYSLWHFRSGECDIAHLSWQSDTAWIYECANTCRALPYVPRIVHRHTPTINHIQRSHHSDTARVGQMCALLSFIIVVIIRWAFHQTTNDTNWINLNDGWIFNH